MSVNGMYAGNAQIPLASKDAVCRPDPEEMLQRCRRRMEEAKDVEASLIRIMDANINVSFSLDDRNGSGAFMTAIGSARLQYIQAKREEQRWLDEIDLGN